MDAVIGLLVTGAATTYLTGTLTALTAEAAAGAPRLWRMGVLVAALGGATLDTALPRTTAPALPLAATAAAVLLSGPARLRPAR